MMDCRSISCFNCVVSCLVLLSIQSVVVSQDVNITIPLNETLKSQNNELYGDFITVKGNSLIQVKFENINKNVSFIIFQVHSHIYNITVYNNTKVRGSYITGTNVGLYSSIKPAVQTFYILNEHGISLKLYISVHGYRNVDPIPGGANMEFPVYISPFMYAKYGRNYINIDAAPALSGTKLDVSVKFYMMYLSERVFDEDTYFRGIKDLLTLDKILENGIEISKGSGHYLSRMRRMVSAYPGVGTIYVAVAYDTNDKLYSVYVPTHTYACDLTNERTCSAFDDVTADFCCAVLLFIGLFTCYFGHRFFKTEMFLMGMFFGIIITFILISLMSTEMMTPALVVVSLISGLFFGAIWLLFWWFYGIPILAVMMTTLHLGFLGSAIFYYRMPGGISLMETDSIFWTAFVAVTIMTSLTLVAATFTSNIVCCAVLGAYAAVFSIDYYLGSNLKYIIINTVRRAVVEKFRFVSLSPPFQWRDATVTVLWVLLAITGVLFQHYHNRGRPPFPPPPRSIGPSFPELPRFIRAYRNRRYGTLDGESPSTVMPRETNPAVPNERSPLI